PDGTELGFVDVPGHERFLPNMLAGVLSIDRVLLIVAADDGPRPQTLEHLDILELIGIAEVTGVVTKIDRVPAERAAEVEAEVAALLADAGYAGSPIFLVWSRTGAGIALLAEHLREHARAADMARGARDRRPPAGQPARRRGAGARDARTESADRACPRRRALCLEPGRQFPGRRRAGPRRLGHRAGFARAGRPHRCRALGLARGVRV